jgi:hypothetical protein
MREEAFVQHLRGAPLLLVHLSGAEDPLLAALTASASLGGDLVPPSPDGLPFRTATVPLHVAMKTFALRSRGLVGLIYAVVLHKRAGSQTLSEHRICIGRSRNTDIVLRDESVSKLHAWFERDEDGNYFVSDSSSHNGTRLNGEPLPPRKARSVAPGDVLYFGKVQTTFCTPADLWSAAVEPP